MYRICSLSTRRSYSQHNGVSLANPTDLEKEKRNKGNQSKKTFLYVINFPLNKLGKRKKEVN